MLLTLFIFCKEKKQKPGLYHQQAENILLIESQLFCQHIDNKYVKYAKYDFSWV